MEQEPLFDAPIPGQSLTAELGGRPWQQPPQYNTVDEALGFYVQRLVDPRFIPGIIDSMEVGIPLTSMANTLQLGGVMQGLHTVDVGILISPVIVEMLAYLAEEAGIEYELGMDDKPSEEGYRPSTIARVKKKLEDQLGDIDLDKMQEEAEVESAPEEEAPDEEAQTGLMARR